PRPTARTWTWSVRATAASARRSANWPSGKRTWPKPGDRAIRTRSPSAAPRWTTPGASWPRRKSRSRASRRRSRSDQHVADRRVLVELGLGEGAQRHDLGLGLARPDHQGVEQLAAHALALEALVDVGVVDDDQRGVGAAVGHLGDALLALLEEEGAGGGGLLVFDAVGHGSSGGGGA